jgi:hypothetical protein
MAKLHRGGTTTSSPTNTASPSNVTSTTTVTPPVGPSNLIKIIVIIFVLVIFVLSLNILWNKRSVKYDLSEYRYGEIMTLQVKPNRTIKVILTYDDILVHSSDEIITIDEKRSQRNLDGFEFISGPIPVASHYYLFRNNSEENITVKLAQFKNAQQKNEVKRKM